MENRKDQRFTVQELSRMSLCVAFCCICAYLSFPLPFTPVMVTLLTFAMAVTAFILPPRQTALTLAVYVFLGAIGIPVYVGGTSGLERLVGPTGGYIWSWLIAYPLLSYCKGAKPSFLRYALLAFFLVKPINYFFGSLQLMAMLHLTAWEAIVMGMLPYIPGDIVKSIGAAFLGVRLQKRLNR